MADYDRITFSGKKTGFFTYSYSDHSLLGIPFNGNYTKVDIPVVNQGGYTIDDVRITQRCWAVRDGKINAVTNVSR